MPLHAAWFRRLDPGAGGNKYGGYAWAGVPQGDALAVSAANLGIILGAAIAAWLFGAAYYGPLGKIWLAAQGRTMEEVKAANENKSGFAKAFPFVLSFIAEIVMAWALFGLLTDMKALTIRGGLIAAGFIWFGFVLTTVAVNNAYPGRKLLLTVIDAGHWLGAMLIIGVIVGGFG